ncbi:MAG: outer membrane beta-barrel protein [Chlamydiales bacterium]|nr:outer membrane beta-barrel protein [Chlamydiales bacterium]
MTRVYILRLFFLLLPLPLLANGWCYRGLDVDLGIGASAYLPMYKMNSNSTWGTQESGKAGFTAQGNVGANWLCRCWLLGIEGFGQYNSAEVQGSSENQFHRIDRSMEMNWDVGVLGRGGFYATPRMTYFVTVGADWGWNTLKEETQTTSISVKKLHTGVRLGGGGEQFLWRNLILREDFAYTWFNEQNYTRGDNTRASISPRLASFLFTLGWLF